MIPADQQITNWWVVGKRQAKLHSHLVLKHFIGHLQSNKVKEVVAAFDAIETIDSDKLLLAVALEAQKQGKVLPIFLQVNVSNDSAKFGFQLAQLDSAVLAAHASPSVKLVGLMTITAQEAAAAVRNDYKTMKRLQEKYQLEELSMGMSADWEIAVEEGATIVRLGSALFGERFSASIHSQWTPFSYWSYWFFSLDSSPL